MVERPPITIARRVLGAARTDSSPQTGSHEVVWWDPSKLKLGEEGDHGLRQEELLKDDGDTSAAAYHAWQEQRAQVIASASHPEFAVFLASQAPDAPTDPISVELLPTRLEAGPTGQRFGTLVHSVLRDVPLDAGPATIRQWAQLNGRILGAPAEEVEAACSRVEAALCHPLLDRSRAAERKHREYPVMLQVDGGRLMEGIIDLAFVENGAWVIVDFKDRRGYVGRSQSIQPPASVVRERSQSPDWLASTGVSARGVDFRSISV